jgi:uncharacterized FlaG/YvyC family protein
MSDQLPGTIEALASSIVPAFAQVAKSGLPAANGKVESSTGKSLPQDEAYAVRDLQSVAHSLTLVSSNIGRDLKFIVDLKSAQPVIQVLDSETGEVIRQIPAAELEPYPLKNGAEGIRMLDTMV